MTCAHDARASRRATDREKQWRVKCDDAVVNAPIELFCDAHLVHDPVGPLITLIDRRWAYCASHAESGHEWRRIAPIERDLLESLPDHVLLICDDRRHLDIGRTVPSGDGVLTIADGKWAYCSASLEEPHHWAQVEPMEFQSIDHMELADRFEGRS
jgi:hypothetical protein